LIYKYDIISVVDLLQWAVGAGWLAIVDCGQAATPDSYYYFWDARRAQRKLDYCSCSRRSDTAGCSQRQWSFDCCWYCPRHALVWSQQRGDRALRRRAIWWFHAERALVLFRL